MNIYEIAQKAGVSIATVSRVINNDSKVKPATRELVKQIMKDEGFIKKSEAVKLRNKTIAFVCSTTANPLVAKTIEVTDNLLFQSGYKMLLYCFEGDITAKKNLMDSLNKADICGVIVECSNFMPYNPEDVQIIFNDFKKPLVLINGFFEKAGIYSIKLDLEKAINILVADYIRTKGNNVLVLFDSMSVTARMMLNGYENAFFVQNLEVDSDYTQLCKDSISVTSYIENLVKKEKMPGLVIASNEILALSARKYLSDENIKIVSLGNTGLCEYAKGPLSYFSTNTDDICKIAVKTMLSALNHEEVPSTNTLPVELINI